MICDLYVYMVPSESQESRGSLTHPPKGGLNVGFSVLAKGTQRVNLELGGGVVQGDGSSVCPNPCDISKPLTFQILNVLLDICQFAKIPRKWAINSKVMLAV